jgi:hypothetical protein
MQSDQKDLFAEINLSDFLASRLESMASFVEQMPQSQFQQSKPEVVMADVVRQFSIAPLVLQIDQKQKKFLPTQVTVVTQGKYGETSPGPLTVAGHQMCVVVPFIGNAQLWVVRPPQIGSGLQPQGLVDTELCTLTLNFAHTSAIGDNWYERKMSEMLNRISMFINCQADTLIRYDHDLTRAVQIAVAQRIETISP